MKPVLVFVLSFLFSVLDMFLCFFCFLELPQACVGDTVEETGVSAPSFQEQILLEKSADRLSPFLQEGGVWNRKVQHRLNLGPSSLTSQSKICRLEADIYCLHTLYLHLFGLPYRITQCKDVTEMYAKYFCTVLGQVQLISKSQLVTTKEYTGQFKCAHAG